MGRILVADDHDSLRRGIVRALTDAHHDVDEAANGNIQLDLHGLQLNVTTISAAQNRKQMMGIEHIALQTDDYAGAVARLKRNGAHIMLEQVSNGHHVAFIEAPDGAQMDLIEKR